MESVLEQENDFYMASAPFVAVEPVACPICSSLFMLFCGDFYLAQLQESMRERHIVGQSGSESYKGKTTSDAFLRPNLISDAAMVDISMRRIPQFKCTLCIFFCFSAQGFPPKPQDSSQSK